MTRGSLQFFCSVIALILSALVLALLVQRWLGGNRRGRSRVVGGKGSGGSRTATPSCSENDGFGGPEIAMGSAHRKPGHMRLMGKTASGSCPYGYTGLLCEACVNGQDYPAENCMPLPAPIVNGRNITLANGAWWIDLNNYNNNYKWLRRKWVTKPGSNNPISTIIPTSEKVYDLAEDEQIAITNLQDKPLSVWSASSKNYPTSMNTCPDAYQVMTSQGTCVFAANFDAETKACKAGYYGIPECANALEECAAGYYSGTGYADITSGRCPSIMTCPAGSIPSKLTARTANACDVCPSTVSRGTGLAAACVACSTCTGSGRGLDSGGNCVPCDVGNGFYRDVNEPGCVCKAKTCGTLPTAPYTGVPTSTAFADANGGGDTCTQCPSGQFAFMFDETAPAVNGVGSNKIRKMKCAAPCEAGKIWSLDGECKPKDSNSIYNSDGSVKGTCDLGYRPNMPDQTICVREFEKELIRVLGSFNNDQGVFDRTISDIVKVKQGSGRNVSDEARIIAGALLGAYYGSGWNKAIQVMSAPTRPNDDQDADWDNFISSKKSSIYMNELISSSKSRALSTSADQVIHWGHCARLGALLAVQTPVLSIKNVVRSLAKFSFIKAQAAFSSAVFPRFPDMVRLERDLSLGLKLYFTYFDYDSSFNSYYTISEALTSLQEAADTTLTIPPFDSSDTLLQKILSETATDEIRNAAAEMRNAAA
jgi:hypothetical protein